MLYRFTLDLAIPEDVYDSIPAAKKLAAREAIRGLKALAVRINEGKDNEEMTVIAQYHECFHDIGGKCEPSIEI